MSDRNDAPSWNNPHGHYWTDCPLCGRMVMCGKCGNNSCNAGYGMVDGKTCDACPSAYDMQDAGEGPQDGATPNSSPHGKDS